MDASRGDEGGLKGGELEAKIEWTFSDAFGKIGDGNEAVVLAHFGEFFFGALAEADLQELVSGEAIKDAGGGAAGVPAVAIDVI